MKKILRILPWCFLALFVIEIVAVILPKKDSAMHTREFGRLPALLNGRIQPLDSIARNSLLQIRSTGDVPLEEIPSWKFWKHAKKLRSTEWLLEVFFKPKVADTRPIFLIHHPDILSELKLGDKGVEKSGLRYYTFNDLDPVLDEIALQAGQSSALKDAERTTYQKQMLKLGNAVMMYQQLKNSVQPSSGSGLAPLLAEYQAALAPGLAAFRAQQSGGTVDDAALKRFAAVMETIDAVAARALPLTIPPTDPKTNRDGWQNLGVSLLGSIRSGQTHPAIEFYARMSSAYSNGDATEFNSAAAGYKNWLGSDFSGEVSKGRAEFYFNQIKLFLHATIIYIFAFVLAGGALLTYGAWPGLSESLRRSAFYLIALAFVVHTAGLIFRMVLEGRPPVTNLYSSAIFIGWGACGLGLVLERFYKVGLGSAVAGFAGFITLLIAHNLALGGDTMAMMQAVLDTNFWLATHVVVVTLGYSSTFVAGILAMAYIALGVMTPILAKNVGKAESGASLGKALANMVFAIVCFATLFSFTGTVLGGIWADQSWGRFWGWDPKENGALLIVIWNVLILHARWGGIIRERGLMNLAIFGNIVTAWSWFGVNMLGIGLHSYGFMDSAFKWLMLFVGSQALLIWFGMLPLKKWRSFRDAT